jgi:hypothetical protein
MVVAGGGDPGSLKPLQELQGYKREAARIEAPPVVTVVTVVTLLTFVTSVI